MHPWNSNTKSTGLPGELNPSSSNRPSQSVHTVSQSTEPPRQVHCGLNQHHNLIVLLQVTYPTIPKISFVNNFLSYSVNRQTNRGKNITSLAEIWVNRVVVGVRSLVRLGECKSEQRLTSPSTRYRSFRRQVFPASRQSLALVLTT